MLPVSLRTNFTDRKARDFFSCAAACPSSQSCSAVRTRTSDGQGQKKFQQLREWQLPPNGQCASARANRRVKRGCETNSGRECRGTFRTQNRTVQTRRG